MSDNTVRLPITFLREHLLADTDDWVQEWATPVGVVYVTRWHDMAQDDPALEDTVRICVKTMEKAYEPA